MQNVSGYMKATFLSFELSTSKNLMRRNFPLSAVLTLLVLFYACKKKNDAGECFSGVSTIRQIVDKPAVVKVTATVNAVYFVEQGAIDTKLVPCNLPKEFIQNDLQVTISGDVKATTQNGGLCCTENFVITKIRR
jgi:hypothetical protein